MKFFTAIFYVLLMTQTVWAWTPCAGDWVSFQVTTTKNNQREVTELEILYKSVDTTKNQVVQETTEIAANGEKIVTEATLDLKLVNRENNTIQGSLKYLCRPTSFENISTVSAGIIKACPLGKEELKTWYSSDVTFNLVKKQEIQADKTKIISLLQSFKKACN